MHVPLHLLAVAALTVLTQVGGLAWLLSLRTRHRMLVFVLAYFALSASAWMLAPLFGRVPLSCGGSGPLRMQSWVYCLANRNYVVPELASAAADLAADVNRRHPGTLTLALDGNFPFFSGFPLLPHLSHDDGRKLDLAFYYMDRQGSYLRGVTRSPIGYFAFEQGPTQCPPHWLSLRWDLDWLQPHLPHYSPEPSRMIAMLDWLATDPRISRVFVEPHLLSTLGRVSPKFGFQGCRAARHDDHVHIQL